MLYLLLGSLPQYVDISSSWTLLFLFKVLINTITWIKPLDYHFIQEITLCDIRPTLPESADCYCCAKALPVCVCVCVLRKK